MPKTESHHNESPQNESDDAILARLENKAIHYLGRYASTRKRLGEVLSRFARRKMPHIDPARMAPLIDRKVGECAQRGFVDDAAYAAAKSASLRRSGGAKRAIEARLRNAGVAPDIIDAAVGGDEMTEKTAALAYARRRRLGPFAGAQKRSREGWQTRHLGSLARAGFGYGIARFVLDFPDGEAVENWLAEYATKE